MLGIPSGKYPLASRNRVLWIVTKTCLGRSTSPKDKGTLSLKPLVDYISGAFDEAQPLLCDFAILALEHLNRRMLKNRRNMGDDSDHFSSIF